MSCHRVVILFFFVCGMYIARVSATEDASITATLGEQLFNDKRLSSDGTVACATCHVRERAFANNETVGKGINRRTGTRNVPSLLDVKHQRALFWDGRAPNLEAQASAPLMNPAEHGLPNAGAALNVVRANATYVRAFLDIYRLKSANEISLGHVAAALAAFERTLISAPTPFDRFFQGGDAVALSAAARRGFELFRGRGRCTTCHTIDGDHPLFTDMQYHSAARALPKTVNDRLSELTREALDMKGKPDSALLETAIASRAEIAALGRFLVTLDPGDIGRFKTPSLRHAASTAPYMHDGSVATLEEAIGLELYNRGAALNYPIVVTAEEKQDLLAFLRSLGNADDR